MILLYLASALCIVWGTAHLFPTRSVVRGFGDISTDNRRILTMEWILEGVALIFIGTVVAAVTAVDRESAVSTVVYALCAAALLVFAAVSLFTGFRVNFPPYKICPFLFTAASILILVGGVIG